ARLARYTGNYEMLVRGMAELGFRPFLDPRIQAPIIVTFHAPADPRYTFREFYDRVREKGFILYPGKLTQVETFRVGCIGAIGPDEIRHAVNAVRDTLADMRVERVAPLAPARAAA
ncbi:MAG TPA: 2-aminoethylphosphonate--pyruvate transaminase, partial [Casimicrobiaceae bacterium]|nr:2-aminoethylphosphonate--pyruvate transaminase [Casimicrobiaceae bacterium]